MKNIKSFTQLKSISEATLNSSKEEIVYTVSRPGRDKIKSISSNISPNLIFEPSENEPDEDDEVIHIRASSFKLVKYSDFKTIYKIADPQSQLIIYETTSNLYPWAVAVKDPATKSTMVIQKYREGASKRGDYFRETAFIITMARRLWSKFRVKIEIASNRGDIPMFYDETDGDAYPNPNRAEFRNRYWEFMDQDKIGPAMIVQCDGLIARFGESAKRIKSIKKNSSDLTINKFFKIALEKERQIMKEDTDYHFIPEKLSSPKWNPSDMWVAFDNYDWMISNRIENVEKRFKRLKVFNLFELNSFLSDSIVHKNGIVGVSLKQQLIDAGKVYDVNVEKGRFIHSYDTYDAKSTSKSVKIKFFFSLRDIEKFIEDDSRQNQGEIDIRTFSTDITAPISMEVKGSKKSGHMSGKAGSYIKYILPHNLYDVLQKIQREKDTKKIAEFVKSNYKFYKEDLEQIFYNDCLNPKSNASNSRMQAVFFTDWLESLGDTDEDKVIQDEIVSDIIRFAKSESNWSAPHLIVK